MRKTKSVRNKKINHDVSGKSFEDKIHNIAKKSGFAVIREVEYKDNSFNQKEKKRKVDFKMHYGKMELILEADGPIHGDLEWPTSGTLRRNADIQKLKKPFIIINQESIKFLIKAMREEEKLNGASEDDITEFLVTYLLWMEYSKFLSVSEYG